MEVFKLKDTAIMPTFATGGSAAFDLSVCLNEGDKVRSYNPHNREFEIPVKKGSDGRGYVSLQPQFRSLIPTGLIFDIPANHVIEVFIRSSMAFKYGVILANSVAVIDSDYTDELFIMVMNTGDTPIMLYHGDRIAQGIKRKTLKTSFEETLIRPAPKQDRTGGIGSTGT